MFVEWKVVYTICSYTPLGQSTLVCVSYSVLLFVEKFKTQEHLQALEDSVQGVDILLRTQSEFSNSLTATLHVGCSLLYTIVCGWINGAAWRHIWHVHP